MKSNRGFTLVEIIVAIAVVGLASTALFGLLSRSLFNLRKLEDLHRYQLAIEEVMTRVQYLPVLPAEGKASGRIPELGAEWTVSVSPWFPATLGDRPAEAVMKIDAELQWNGRSGGRSFHLETVKPAKIDYGNHDLNQAISAAFPQ